MNEGPIILDAPEPPAWPESSGAGMAWPELDLPPPFVQSDAAQVLPEDFASEIFLMPVVTETLMLPSASEQGPPGPQEVFIDQTPAIGYPAISFMTGAFPAAPAVAGFLVNDP